MKVSRESVFEARPGSRMLGIHAPILGTLTIPPKTPNPTVLLNVPSASNTNTLSLGLKSLNLLNPSNTLGAGFLGQSLPVFPKPATLDADRQSQPNIPVKDFEWSDFIKKSAEGVTLAAGPIALTALPNVSTAEEIARQLTLHNVPAGMAGDVSNNLFAFLKSHFGAALCVGIAGGIVTIFILDGAKVRKSATQKLLIACAVVAMLTLLTWAAFHSANTQPLAAAKNPSAAKTAVP